MIKVGQFRLTEAPEQNARRDDRFAIGHRRVLRSSAAGRDDARRSGAAHQRGWIVERGKKWYGYYRRIFLDPITNERKTDVVSVILGLKSQLTKGAAREALQKEIAKQTGQNLGGRIMKDGSVTFGWFVRNRYYPLRDWRPETEKVKKIQMT